LLKTTNIFYALIIAIILAVMVFMVNVLAMVIVILKATVVIMVMMKACSLVGG
jgi:hypothetical protein